MKKIFNKIKCYFGFHDWKNIDSSLMPEPKKGEMICWSELHKCKNCGKEEYLAMGCIC